MMNLFHLGQHREEAGGRGTRNTTIGRVKLAGDEGFTRDLRETSCIGI